MLLSISALQRAASPALHVSTGPLLPLKDEVYTSCLPAGPDATKDPCLKVRCPPHKVCVSRDYQTAICINHKQPAHR